MADTLNAQAQIQLQTNVHVDSEMCILQSKWSKSDASFIHNTLLMFYKNEKQDYSWAFGVL